MYNNYYFIVIVSQLLLMKLCALNMLLAVHQLWAKPIRNLLTPPQLLKW